MFLWQFHQFEPHLADTRIDEPELPSYAIGYINFTPFLIGTPIIDTYQFKLSVPGVDDPHSGPKRKVGMRGGEGFAIKVFPIGGLLTVEPRPIPTGVADPSLNRLDGLA